MGPATSSYYTRVAYYNSWINDITTGLKDDHFGPSTTPRLDCPSNITCDQGRCIPEVEICNLYADCFDGSDEKFCQTQIDDAGVIMVLNKNVTSRQLDHSKPGADQEIEEFDPSKVSLHAIKASNTDCGPGNFICKDVHQCIPQERKCDLKRDCIDGTDEQDCLCRDYFEAHQPARLCDGYPDCYDFSDEMGCQPCNPGEFYCHLSKICIPQSQVCNEEFDCQRQEDERYCLALVKSDQMNVDIYGKPQSLSQGLLAVHKQGSWRLVCLTQFQDSTSSGICKYLGYQGAKQFNKISTNVFPHLLHAPIPTKP